MIYALRAYYPRFSYAREYLPAVYQHDSGSTSFLERFLANPEGTFTEVEGRIGAVQRLFDVDSCPTEYLDWLAGWLGASFESEWSTARRRLFSAPRFGALLAARHAARITAFYPARHRPMPEQSVSSAKTWTPRATL